MANNDQGNRRGLRWTLVALTVFILIITAVVLLGLGDEKEPPKEQQAQSSNAKGVAGSFVRAVLVTDGPTSFDLMSERLQKQLGGLPRWSIFLSANFGGGEELITLAETEEVQASDDSKPLRLIYAVGVANKSPGKLEVVMRQIDGSWKVDEFVYSSDGS